jgi:hypothetical protein
MTLQAECPHIRQIALAAAFHHRDDVVGVPQVSPAAPLLLELPPCLVVEFPLVFPERLRVDPTQPAYAAIARAHLRAKIAGVGAPLPFVDARRAAKREAAPGNFAAAPAARNPAPLDPSAGLRPARAHTRSSYPRPRMPSIMPSRIWPTSSDESVRSGDPTVSRKETLLRPSSSGGPAYCRTN